MRRRAGVVAATLLAVSFVGTIPACANEAAPPRVASTSPPAASIADAAKLTAPRRELLLRRNLDPAVSIPETTLARCQAA